MKSYQQIRAERVEGGIYAGAAKVETSIKAEALRISLQALKDQRLKARIEYVLTQALYNADDTNADGFGGRCNREQTRDQFWDQMFRSSAFSLADCESDKRVSKFFKSRAC